MESGRILKTLGSETKNFITQDTISSTNISVFVLGPLALGATGVTQMDGCTCSGLLHSCGTLSLGNSLVLQQTVRARKTYCLSRGGSGGWRGGEMLPHFLKLLSTQSTLSNGPGESSQGLGILVHPARSVGT